MIYYCCYGVQLGKAFCLLLLYAGDVVWGVEHFSAVQDLIWDARANYQQLGLSLGFLPGTISAIKQTHHYDTVECFNQVLEDALKKGLSRNKLAGVLESKQLGYGQLAQRVRAANFCKLFYIHVHV